MQYLEEFHKAIDNKNSTPTFVFIPKKKKTDKARKKVLSGNVLIFTA